MKKLFLTSFFSFLFFGVFGQEQVFDYSKFPAAPTVINLEQSFSISNFNACWNLKFSYKDNAGTIRTKTWLGRNLAQKLLLSNEPLKIKISDDRKRLIAGQLTYDEEIPSVSSVTFEAIKDSDIIECAVANKKLGEVGKRIATTTPIAGIEEISIPTERNPFYDAILLQDMLKLGKEDQIKALLALYEIDDNNIGSNDVLNIYKPDFFPTPKVNAALSVAISSEKMLTSSQGGSDFVSILTDALAQFIAKRVKEELTLAYLNRFRNFLEEKNAQTYIGTLLPESYKVMTEVEPYGYTTYWQAMQEGFQDDVAQFPENTMDFIRKHEAKFTDKNLYAGTLTGLYTLRGAYRRYSAVTILDSVELLPEIQKFDPTTNIGSALRTLSLLSRNLHHKDGKGWVRPHELAALANERTLHFFLGLLIAREDIVTQQILFKAGSNSISLKKVLLNEYKTPKFRQQLNGLLAQLELLFDREKQVEKDFDKINDDSKNKIRTTFERYETYAKQLLNLIDYSAGLVNSLPSTGAKAQAISKKVTDYTAIAHTSIDLTKHMYEKRYNLAFFDVVKLLKDLKVDYFKTNVDTVGLKQAEKNALGKYQAFTGLSNLNKISLDEILNGQRNIGDITADSKDLTRIFKTLFESFVVDITSLNQPQKDFLTANKEKLGIKDLSKITLAEIQKASESKLQDADMAISKLGEEIRKIDIYSTIVVSDRDKLINLHLLSGSAVRFSDLEEAETKFKEAFKLEKALDQLKKRYEASTAKNFWEDFVRYGTFIANVAGADSAAQIVAALEAAALPVGSYRIKHDYNFTVSLNSYGGISGAHEFLSRVSSTQVKEKEGFMISPSAPIGVHLGWGFKGKLIESFGLFVPLIDIGAAFALRFQGKTDSLAALPNKLSWDNILSPGLYTVFGFRNSPITFSLGGQYGVGLRKLNYLPANNSPVPFSAQSVWVGGTISVDIPLFNLHVSKGKRK